MARDGFGYDYAPWDKAITEKFKDQLAKLGAHQKYGQVEIFKSPKGRWMAFHNPSYGDIRIVDLESGDVVAKDFYSSTDPKVYGHHANFTTFVPSYFYENLYEGKPEHGDKVRMNLSEVFDYEDSDFETVNWDNLYSVPIAFNSWTIWAADNEFYVDAIDLRRVDEGVILPFKGAGFTLTRGASHVRQFIKHDSSYWVKVRTQEERAAGLENELSCDRGEFVVSFDFLEEKSGTRLMVAPKGELFKFEDGNKDADSEYQHDELPWVGLKRRMDEYEANRANKVETKNGD